MHSRQLQRIVAGNIKRVRKELGLTQSHLAENAGISTGYMCDIERARRWPSADILARLSAALKLDPFQLLLPTIDYPCFDRRHALTIYSRQLKEALEDKISTVFDNMMQPNGPLRMNENNDILKNSPPNPPAADKEK